MRRTILILLLAALLAACGSSPIGPSSPVVAVSLTTTEYLPPPNEWCTVRWTGTAPQPADTVFVWIDWGTGPGFSWGVGTYSSVQTVRVPWGVAWIADTQRVTWNAGAAASAQIGAGCSVR
jgi:hypothetical protein